MYWPDGLPHFDFSVTNFERAFQTLGYVTCPDGSREDGLEKIAFYGSAAEVTHTARQLPVDGWTSKLGPEIDIKHPAPESLEGVTYGNVVAYMSRPRRSENVPDQPIV